MLGKRLENGATDILILFIFSPLALPSKCIIKWAYVLIDDIDEFFSIQT